LANGCRRVLVAALHAYADVRNAIPLCLALMMVMAGGCAHRRATTTTSALLNPSSPPRDVAASEDALRAGQSLDRLRRSIQDRKAAPVESRTEFRATDKAAPPAQPTGTSWSVVVGSAAPAPGKTEAAVRPQSSESTPDASEPERRSPWQRRLNVIGGLVGALCGALVLRKRARESSVRHDDLAA